MTRRSNKRGREAIRSLQALGKFERGEDARFRQYRVSRKPNLSSELRKRLELRSSADLYSVNPVSRIQVATALDESLQSHFHARGTTEAYFVTLISEKHSARADDNAGYDVAAHRLWIDTVLAGIDYIGMIEPAIYPAVSFMPDGNADWISWHAHIVVWNTTAADLKDLKDIINDSENAFRPGGTVFHYRKANPRKIEPEVAYMCKSPRSEHYTYPAKRVVVDPVTRKRAAVPTGVFKQNKRQLRTGKRLIVLSAMEELLISDLCVHGGAGREIAANALLAAKRVLVEDQRARDAAIRSL
jgi:hypothetical protein